MTEHSKIEELTSNLKEYAQTRFELFKLKATDQVSEIGSEVVSGLVVGITGLFFLLFLSVAGGFFFSDLTGSRTIGFLIVAGIYLLAAIILFAGRKKIMSGPVRDKIIRQVFSKN